MDFFLGDQNKFGVEVKQIYRDDKKTLLGFARLWMGGNFLGTIYDCIYLDGYLLGGLYQLLRVKEMTNKEFPDEIEYQYSYFVKKANDIDDGSNNIDDYRINFGTLTDSFGKWAYRKGEFITIIWKLENRTQVINYNDLIDYPQNIFSYTINYSDLNEFVEKLDWILTNW